MTDDYSSDWASKTYGDSIFVAKRRSCIKRSTDLICCVPLVASCSEHLFAHICSSKPQASTVGIVKEDLRFVVVPTTPFTFLKCLRPSTQIDQLLHRLHGSDALSNTSAHCYDLKLRATMTSYWQLTDRSYDTKKTLRACLEYQNYAHSSKSSPQQLRCLARRAGRGMISSEMRTHDEIVSFCLQRRITLKYKNGFDIAVTAESNIPKPAMIAALESADEHFDHLMDLPTEMRLLVYTSYFASLPGKHRFRKPPPLTETCRIVRKEALLPFYQTSEPAYLFLQSPPWPTSDQTQVFRRMPAEALAEVQELKIAICAQGDSGASTFGRVKLGDIKSECCVQVVERARERNHGTSPMQQPSREEPELSVKLYNWMDNVHSRDGKIAFQRDDFVALHEIFDYRQWGAMMREHCSLEPIILVSRPMKRRR